jgi:hypothetical protein
MSDQLYASAALPQKKQRPTEQKVCENPRVDLDVDKKR